jgi:hypothetical protein
MNTEKLLSQDSKLPLNEILTAMEFDSESIKNILTWTSDEKGIFYAIEYSRDIYSYNNIYNINYIIYII